MTGAATPGQIDLVPWADPTERVAPIAPAGAAQTAVRAREPIDPAAGASTPATVLEAWSGVADALPLAGPAGANEQPLAAGAGTADDGYGYPYQRFVLEASAGAPIAWTGTTVSRNELQLMVWSAGTWRLIDAGQGELSGVFDEADVVDGRANVLVIDGPAYRAHDDRRYRRPAAGPGGLRLRDHPHHRHAVPLRELPRGVHAAGEWIADNADDRKIAFATHTGDLIQNWVDPAQNEVRARVEFERASAIQSILDDAGVPNSVLPGNHDNKRGVTDELFNEYFDPHGTRISPGTAGRSRRATTARTSRRSSRTAPSS